MFSCSGDDLLPVKGPEGAPGTDLNFAQFDDIPIPLNSTLNKEDSIIISKLNGWLGRLSFDTSEKQLTVFDFFRNEFPKFGWKKLSEITSERSLLNYKNNSRLASIQLNDKTFFGTEVTITVSEIEN
ncbi:MAG: hypothetical protein CMM95_02825 [Rickettsiales bacterium]|nr:hypothetical protein [Rickettsiales bacterium]